MCAATGVCMPHRAWLPPTLSPRVCIGSCCTPSRAPFRAQSRPMAAWRCSKAIPSTTQTPRPCTSSPSTPPCAEHAGLSIISFCFVRQGDAAVFVDCEARNCLVRFLAAIFLFYLMSFITIMKQFGVCFVYKWWHRQNCYRVCKQSRGAVKGSFIFFYAGCSFLLTATTMAVGRPACERHSGRGCGGRPERCLHRRCSTCARCCMAERHAITEARGARGRQATVACGECHVCQSRVADGDCGV